jgi:hypothetical protein
VRKYGQFTYIYVKQWIMMGHKNSIKMEGPQFQVLEDGRVTVREQSTLDLKSAYHKLLGPRKKRVRSILYSTSLIHGTVGTVATPSRAKFKIGGNDDY